MTPEKALSKLQHHLGNFNADTAEMIRSYWGETAMKINLIFVMMDLRDKLEHERNSELNNKLQDLKLDFVNYINEKLSNRHLSDNDDLIFEVTSVAKYHLDNAKEIVIKDIKSSELEEPLKSDLVKAFEENNYNEALSLLN